MDIVAHGAARVVDLPVEAGPEIEAGATVAVLEVMKMEHPVTTETGGRIEAVFVEIGSTVESGDRLARLDPDGSAGLADDPGTMGLEGAVRLGFKRELEAIEDPVEREREVERRVEEMYQVGKGVNVASHFEIDDVIDPADTRSWIRTCLL